MNSFGYGGANAHVVLDDAFHYLEERKLQGKHHTMNLLPLPEPTSHEPKTIEKICQEDYQSSTRSISHSSPKLLVWSSADEMGLSRLGTAYHSFLSGVPQKHQRNLLRDLSYTLAVKRTALPWKSFVISDSVEDLQSRLPGKLSKPVRSSSSPSLHFIFTGQGAQWPGMGCELLCYPVFLRSIEFAEKHFSSLGSPWSLKGARSHPCV